MTDQIADQMRACSANEVFHIARKACIGSGLTPDRADDLAEAATLLQCSGYAGLSALHRLLVRHGRAEHTPQLQLSLSAGQIQADLLRPEAEGVAVIDWLISHPETGQADCAVLCDDMMFAGLLLAAVRAYGGWFTLHLSGSSDPVHIVNTSIVAELPASAGWRLYYHAGPPSAEALVYHHTDVAFAIWTALGKLAHLTYVPASEASRQSGAGAGLVDND